MFRGLAMLVHDGIRLKGHHAHIRGHEFQLRRAQMPRKQGAFNGRNEPYVAVQRVGASSLGFSCPLLLGVLSLTALLSFRRCGVPNGRGRCCCHDEPLSAAALCSPWLGVGGRGTTTQSDARKSEHTLYFGKTLRFRNPPPYRAPPRPPPCVDASIKTVLTADSARLSCKSVTIQRPVTSSPSISPGSHPPTLSRAFIVPRNSLRHHGLRG